MGKKSGPSAPNYQAAAEQQGQDSAYNTSLQTWGNRPNMTTPWGSQTWNSTQQIDPATGKPVTQWSSNISLSPDQQHALDDQMAIQSGRSDAAKGLLDQATGSFDTPFNWGGMPDRSSNVSLDTNRFANYSSIDAGPANRTLNSDPTAIRQEAQDAVWNLQKPMLEEQQKSMESSLLNQGVSMGSDAWATRQREQDDAMARARLQSVAAGRDEANQMFQQDLASSNFENNAKQTEFDNLMARARAGDSQALQMLTGQISAGSFNNQNRQQAISEETMRRDMPLNELNALLSGQQVNMPQMPSFMGAGRADTTQYLPAAQMQYDASLDRYNANAGFMDQLMGGASSALQAYMMFSDARLKEDVVQLGILSSGCPVVYYRYRGLPLGYIGVIAQDAQRFCPEAVALDPSGFLQVDYSKVR